MSFTSEVKAEIAQNELHECCVRAQLAAFIQLNASLSIVNQQYQLVIQIENATIAKRIYSLLKSRYGELVIELSVMKKQNLKKNNIYILRVVNQVRAILDDLGIMGAYGLRKVPYASITVKECCARAYIAGAFMANGSINAPQKTNYHCEISCNSETFAKHLVSLLSRFNFKVKTTVRRHTTIVYMKASDQIADFLRLIGASQATLNFEDIRIQRDFRNSLTRLDNCEVANEVKTLNAGKKQIEAIEKLQRAGRLPYLDVKLQEIAALRLAHPEASLNELADLIERDTGQGMSKSGLQHRFSKLIELAMKVKEV